MTKCFELHVLRRSVWTIDKVFDCREAALSMAHDMEEYSPEVTLRVVEESFDPPSGRVESVIIYRTPPIEEDRHRSEERFLDVLRKSKTPEPRKPRQAHALTTTPRSKRRKPSFVGALVTLVLVIGGIGLAAIYGLIWFGEGVH